MLSWHCRELSFGNSVGQLGMVSMLQQGIKEAKVKHWQSDALSRVAHTEKTMSFVNVGCDDAYGTMPGGKFQQGGVVVLVSPDIKEKTAIMNVVEWQFTSCKRIVRSPTAIGASAASMALGHAE